MALALYQGVLYESKERSRLGGPCDRCAFRHAPNGAVCVAVNTSATDGRRCIGRIWVRSTDQSHTAMATYWLEKE